MKHGDAAWAQFTDDGLWALDELDRVVGGDTLASSPTRHSEGEWDVIRALSTRTRRRLTGARYMRRGGMQPDQLAELITPRVPGCETTDDAIEWYVKAALAAIDEARLLAGRRRRLRLAQRNGHTTYYDYRTADVRARGYGSVWDMRRRKKWN